MATFSRRGALLLISGLALAACSPAETKDGESEMDFSTTEQAVKAACRRVVSFGEPTASSTNGFGRSLFMAPDFDSDAPVSVEDLDAIVKAIWQNAPFEPNAIRLSSRDAATGKIPIDLRTPAEELTPMGSSPYGDRGVALTDMADRYGAWKKPA